MRGYGLRAVAGPTAAIVMWIMLLSGVYGLLVGLMAVRCELALAFWEPDAHVTHGAPGLRLALLDTAAGWGRCLVCATGIEKGQVQRACATCDTALHAECYEYLGGCARFGCAEARGVASLPCPRRA